MQESTKASSHFWGLNFKQHGSEIAKPNVKVKVKSKQRGWQRCKEEVSSERIGTESIVDDFCKAFSALMYPLTDGQRDECEHVIMG